MMIEKNTNILVIGLGVIGGGYAIALSEKGYKINCITKEQKDIDYALERGMITYGTTEVDEKLVSDADLIIFALYPTIFIEWVKKYNHLFKNNTIITDVTGVKGSVVEEIQSLLPDGVEFISAHPMAGRERSGVEYADPSVFRGANYIVTPTKINTDRAINLCCELGELLGFTKISILSPEEHDQMIGFLSQLTHCIAVTLMTCRNTDGLEKYTGDSFRDLTRIAKINDEMWSELFLMNKDALLTEMDAFAEEFARFRNMVASDNRDEMRRIMRESTKRRSLFDKPTK